MFQKPSVSAPAGRMKAVSPDEKFVKGKGAKDLDDLWKRYRFTVPTSIHRLVFIFHDIPTTFGANVTGFLLEETEGLGWVQSHPPATKKVER